MADGNGLPAGAASGGMEAGQTVNGAGSASPTPTSSSGAGASGSANQGYHQLSVTSEQTKESETFCSINNGPKSFQSRRLRCATMASSSQIPTWSS